LEQAGLVTNVSNGRHSMKQAPAEPVAFGFLDDLTDRDRTSRLDFARDSAGLILRF
jgi:hypothetical protein